MPDADANRNILAIIPARAGSKGIPGKNLRALAGVPLLARAINWAHETKYFSRVLLTTDSAEFATLGKKYGAETPFIRPPELAQDNTPMLPVLRHAVDWVIQSGWTPEIIVLLQPTAPFRKADDLRRGLKLIQAHPEADSVVSVEAIPDHYSPHYAMKIEAGELLPFLPEGARVTRRQDASKSYSRNGQFYIMRRQILLEKDSIYGKHCLPLVTNHKAVNLDTLDDWAEAEKLAEDFFQHPA